MKDFKIILKYFKKIGYPNKNLIPLFKSLDYDWENFLPDLVEYLGEDGAHDFVQKTIDKLNTPKGIKIDLSDEGYPESYIYLIIKNFYIDLNESEDAILIKYSWGDGMFMHPDEGRLYTKEELYQDTDMQEWSDMLDMFEGAGSHFFGNNCGYWLWYE
jgi:hypothetical protein